MNISLLVISEYGSIERVRTPFSVYNINSPEFIYGKLFTVDSILMENDEILFAIDGRNYKHGCFEIYLNPSAT
jgi:hypothetical protein